MWIQSIKCGWRAASQRFVVSPSPASPPGAGPALDLEASMALLPPAPPLEANPATRANARPGAWRAALLTGSSLLVLGVLAIVYLSIHRESAATLITDKLSIALSSTPHAALLHIAAAKGYFTDEGLDVSVMPVTHGKAALDLLAQGKSDLASAAEVPFVIAVMKGADLGIAATMASISTEMAVVVRRDRSIGHPRDLAQKRIGVTFGTSGEYFLWAFLIRNKLTPGSITLVDLPPDQLVLALTEGRIDAAAMWQPLVSQAESTLGNLGQVFTEPSAYTVMHVLVGRNEFLRTHRIAVQKLLRAMLKAEEFNRNDPHRAMELTAQRLKIPVQSLQAGWGELDLAVDMQQSQLITLEDEARWAIARGHAPPGPLPNFLPHLSLDALLAVLPERVSVVR